MTLEKYFSAFTSDDPEKILSLETEREQANTMMKLYKDVNPQVS